MHGPHKSRRLLVGGPDDATVRPFLVPLRCYYCATLIGQKSTLIREDIYTLFHLGQSWMKQVGEDPRIATYKLGALPLYTFPPGYLYAKIFIPSASSLFLSVGGDLTPHVWENFTSNNFKFLRLNLVREAIWAGGVILLYLIPRTFYFVRKLKICHT